MNKPTIGLRSLLPAALAGTLLAGPALAWHPHPDITRAAVEALGDADAFRRELGPELIALREYSCLPDWRRQLHRNPALWFYADDYLLFPGMPQHIDHMCPEVQRTYAPYFRRALQALQTENAPNAGRWVGALVHFVEDTGAPPHAARVGGDLHGKTENWADPERLHIAGYAPQALGQTEAEAIAGLCRRMDGLIEFSKPRFERAKPFALSGDRARADPIIVESAAESARVVADLLRTLGALTVQLPEGHTATLRGTVLARPAPGLERMPAKVLLLGTAFSTLADAEGRFIFRHLPPGTYTLAGLRPGSAVATDAVTLAADQETTRDLTLPPDAQAGNLVRNPALTMHWLTPEAPDGWYRIKDTWEGELLPLHAGTQYRLQVTWQPAATGRVGIKLLGSAGPNKPGQELRALAAGATQLDFTATPETAYAQIVISAAAAPDKIFRHIAVWPTGAAPGK